MAIDNDVVQRLRSARGHLDAVAAMVEADRSCIEVLHQLSAVQGALDAVRRRMLERYVGECLEAAESGGEAGELVNDILTAAFGGPAVATST